MTGSDAFWCLEASIETEKLKSFLFPHESQKPDEKAGIIN